MLVIIVVGVFFVVFSGVASVPGKPHHQGACDQNCTKKTCPNSCPPTCENPGGVKVCSRMCLAYGCECNPGYVSNNGSCIKPEDCPGGRCKDPNATFKKNPNPCPETCAFPGGRPCDAPGVDEGCECNPGFYLNDKNKCVKFQDCPGAKTCSSNETFVFCNMGCPIYDCPSTDHRGIIACASPYPCASGCGCRQDFLRNHDGRCIKYSDCPPIKCTRPNEIYSARPPPCLFDKCTDIGKENKCHTSYPNRPQCVCKPGFYRDKNDICVCKEECAKPPPKCGLNEIYKENSTICPPQRCDIAYTQYFCIKQTESYPGCDCLPGHLRDSENVCIPANQCPGPPVIPTCGENEVLSRCKIVCPSQSCESRFKALYKCPDHIPCEWGCDCVEGHLRNADGKCIPSEECPNPKPCGHNEVHSKCAIECPPQTCESIFTSYSCSNVTQCKEGCDCLDGYLRNKSGICVPSQECFPEQVCDIAPECRPTCANAEPGCCHVPTSNTMDNQDGCKCKTGYILADTNGPCIRVEECPGTDCMGDPNAVVTACPWPCISTCSVPNAGSFGHTCDSVGCQCKPGFIIDDDTGKCILPEQCKCPPCGVNGTFSECAFRCPNQVCPQDDSQTKVACKPGRPCPSGCLCKPYYLRKSYTDDTCVLASDCPPVNCTRPNEVWNACTSECLAESCNDLTTKSECSPDPNNCQPQCVCCVGYYRNESGICVRKEECPNQCDVQQECRPTCGVPNPPNCPYIPPSEANVDSCNCQSGFVLSAPGGQCIKIEDCVRETKTCNGDPNAIIKECPLPCPSTCSSPNAVPCKRKCESLGCECKPGYLKAENGTCVLPDACPGGNPCGDNEVFSSCPYRCPTNYCPTNDSRVSPVCETSPFAPCYPGCVCQLNHRRLSLEDPRCIVSSDCPPVNCTGQNEEWNSCPLDCQSEYCEAVTDPPTVCNTLVHNCNPKCQCKKGYFRRDDGVCVCSEECRELNSKKERSHVVVIAVAEGKARGLDKEKK